MGPMLFGLVLLTAWEILALFLMNYEIFHIALHGFLVQRFGCASSWQVEGIDRG
jgi:hypothetical protein